MGEHIDGDTETERHRDRHTERINQTQSRTEAQNSLIFSFGNYNLLPKLSCFICPSSSSFPRSPALWNQKRPNCLPSTTHLPEKH